MRVGRGIVAALLAGGAATGAWAGEVPLYRPAPDWVKPAPPIDAKSAASASAPIMLLYDTQQRLQDGQVWNYVDTATRMASAEVLAQAGTVTLPWQPARGDLIVHRLEIVRGAEHIDLLGPDAKKFTVIRREQQLEQREVNGVLTATLPIEGLRIGDVLHLTASITSRDAALGGQVQTAGLLPAAPQRIGYTRTRLLWPERGPVHWKSYADGVKPVEATVGGMHEWTVEGVLPKQPEWPTDMPVRFSRPTMVEASSFADWAAVSKTMAPLYATAGLIPAGSPLAAEVARISAAETDPVKRAALALDLVQDKIRYLYNGMDGGNYVPQTPAQTWALRYGDCKAKTLLLLALLHAMAIDAEPVVAPAQAGDIIDGRLPSPGAFDHVLVRATIGGEVLWLDGTMTGTRLADIHDAPAFRRVLPLRSAGAELMPVPFRADARPDAEVDLTLDQRAGVPLPTLLTARIRFRGQPASMIGLAAEQANLEQRRNMVQELVNKVIGEARLSDQTIAYDAAAGVATISATGLLTTGWTRERERRRLTLDRAVGQIGFTPDRARAAWRPLPVATGGAERIVYRTRLLLPLDGKGFALSGDEALTGTIAGHAITRHATLAGGVVTVEEENVTTVPEIPADQVVATRTRVALAKTRLLEAVAPADLPSMYATATAAKASGAIKPILAAYAKAIADDPEDRDNHLNRARFLVGIYDYAGAIPDLTRALAIEPDADTYLWRASLYRIAGDAAKRKADLDEALALEPGSLGVIAALAEYRLDAGEKDQALAMVQEHIDAGGKDATTYLATKAELLGRAGRPQEALAAADQAVAQDPANAALLNQRCWLKGTLGIQLDTALKDCTRSLELSDSRVAALDSRAMVYYRLNRFDEAMADLTEVLKDAPDLPASLYMRGVIRGRQGQAAGARADVATARAIAPLIDADYARWGIKP